MSITVFLLKPTLQPIRKPIGMHAQQALGLLVRWALANLTPEFPNTPRENCLATCDHARLPPKST